MRRCINLTFSQSGSPNAIQYHRVHLIHCLKRNLTVSHSWCVSRPGWVLLWIVPWGNMAGKVLWCDCSLHIDPILVYPNKSDIMTPALWLVGWRESSQPSKGWRLNLDFIVNLISTLLSTLLSLVNIYTVWVKLKVPLRKKYEKYFVTFYW